MPRNFDQPDWLISYRSGIAGGETWILMAESEHFAMIEVPGHHYWRGLPPTQSGYAPKSLRLVTKSARYHSEPFGHHPFAEGKTARSCRALTAAVHAELYTREDWLARGLNPVSGLALAKEA